MCVHVYAYCVPGVHICVFKCAHMGVPTGHVLVFQENACIVCCQMNARECVFRAHIYIYIYLCLRVQIYVSHVYTDVCSRVRTSVFQLDTCLCARRTRACYQVNTRVCVCVSACAQMCVCSRVQYTCVCSRVRMCVSHVYIYMCVHVYTHVCSYQKRVCVPGEHMFVFR